jgi:hypothetical protein
MWLLVEILSLKRVRWKENEGKGDSYKGLIGIEGDKIAAAALKK